MSASVVSSLMSPKIYPSMANEEDGEETGEGFCEAESEVHQQGFDLACQQLSEQCGPHQPQSPPGALQINSCALWQRTQV